MWKIFTSSNLNPLLKLFFYSLILTNNNLLLKIYCEILWQYFSIRIFYFLYYFSSFHFIFIHVSFLFFFFLFLVFLLHTRHTAPLLFIFFFTSRTFQCFTSERERGEIGLGLHRMHLHHRSNRCSSISTAARRPPYRSTWVRSACSFFCFFFSFFHICLFLFNFILRIGFCFVFGLCEKRGQIGFFFFFFFFHICLF